jgi:predicted restriction endonuclease
MGPWVYACALAAYQLTKISAGSMVDGAHIHPFASSWNSGSRNGLALCKNAI